VLSGKQIRCPLLAQQLAVYLERHNASSEYLDHGVKSAERNVEEGSIVVEAVFENDGVQMRIPPEHIAKTLVG